MNLDKGSWGGVAHLLGAEDLESSCMLVRAQSPPPEESDRDKKQEKVGNGYAKKCGGNCRSYSRMIRIKHVKESDPRRATLDRPISDPASPALLMIEDPPPLQWSGLSREISVIPDRRRGFIIESAGEP